MAIIDDRTKEQILQDIKWQENELAKRRTLKEQNKNTFSGGDLSKKFGLSYDYDALNKLFSSNVEQTFKARAAEQAQMDRKSTDQMYGLQSDMLGENRRNLGSAIGDGSAFGAYMAKDLLANLGWQDKTGDIQTQMVMDQQQMAQEKQAALAQASQYAMELQNSTGMQAGNLSAMFDSNNVQREVGQLDADARRYTADADVNIANISAAAQRDAARYSGYGGGGDSSSTFKDLEDMISQGKQDSFIAYVMSTTGVSEKEARAWWDEANGITAKDDRPPIDLGEEVNWIPAESKRADDQKTGKIDRALIRSTVDKINAARKE